MPTDPPPKPDRKDANERDKTKAAPDKDTKEGDAETPDVRVAGRKEMDLPPRDWDEVDEEVDESFPASDPPANY